jgi:hypothetical protein
MNTKTIGLMKGKFAIILNPASTLATPEIDIYEKIMPLTSIIILTVAKP